MATAKTLAQALELPVAAAPTLKSFAFANDQFFSEEGEIKNGEQF